jgi:hypothetical protein
VAYVLALPLLPALVIRRVVGYATAPIRSARESARWRDKVFLDNSRMSRDDVDWLIQRLQADWDPAARWFAAGLEAGEQYPDLRGRLVLDVELQRAILRVLDDPPTEELRQLRESLLKARASSEAAA